MMQKALRGALRGAQMKLEEMPGLLLLAMACTCSYAGEIGTEPAADAANGCKVMWKEVTTLPDLLLRADATACTRKADLMQALRTSLPAGAGGQKTTVALHLAAGSEVLGDINEVWEAACASSGDDAMSKPGLTLLTGLAKSDLARDIGASLGEDGGMRLLDIDNVYPLKHSAGARRSCPTQIVLPPVLYFQGGTSGIGYQE